MWSREGRRSSQVLERHGTAVLFADPGVRSAAELLEALAETLSATLCGSDSPFKGLRESYVGVSTLYAASFVL